MGLFLEFRVDFFALFFLVCLCGIDAFSGYDDDDDDDSSSTLCTINIGISIIIAS